ncbi:MAG: DUF1501 domain-containing protein [Acidobacteria bacterium]|nr:DUF1501 domain-containing protein [Acidobacteriota bacterium]
MSASRKSGSDAGSLALHLTRRHFFGRAASGIGVGALAHLLGGDLRAESGLPGLPHHAPKAKRVIYLFQSGGPAQMDLFDYKPGLAKMHKQDLPASVRGNQRLTGMTAAQDRFPVAASAFQFAQHGQSGAWISELLPHTAKIVDKIAILRSMHTEPINHDPAITFLQTGHQLAGRPSIGSWLAYGLGSDNENLPAFVVMTSYGKTKGQPLYSRLWGSGWLPTRYAGVKFRSGKDPVLYLSNPDGFDEDDRRGFLDDLGEMNRIRYDKMGDPEIETRIAQYEMAFRMQSSVPELTDLSSEPESVFELYGEDSRKPGTFAANCLLARRLAERGVRFVQLFHRGWDHHGDLPRRLAEQCQDVDQASAALIQDLEQRGMLEDTLVVWGGEFGRTVYCQGAMTEKSYGRDHHPRCFTMWAAGGGLKPGLVYGETDDFSYNVVKDPLSVHDFHATLLDLLGVDHRKLTFKYQGRDFRLTDVHGELVPALKA